MSLKYVLYTLQRIAEHSGRKDKERIISDAVNSVDYFKYVVYYAIHPFKQFNTKHVEYIPYVKHDPSVEDIFHQLDYLAQQRGAKDEDIYLLSTSASIDEETVEVVRRIVNKDLECEAGLKTFRKFIPEIPEYDVMRAESDIHEFFKIHNYDLSKYYYSIKFDGVRTQTNGNGVYLSRNGKEFPNFYVFNDEIQELINNLSVPVNENTILDGEVIHEEFQDLMTQVRRLNNVDPSKFKFYIFDIVLDRPFYERYQILRDAFNRINNEKIELVEHRRCDEFNTVNELKELSERMVDEGYEGLVLKDAESPYELKKSKHWCKVKRIYTADVKVIDWLYGTKKNKNRIGKFVCQFSDGTEFEVGSGLTEREREYYMENTPSIIEIEYQETTKDGKPRFPIFKRVREDKNEID